MPPKISRRVFGPVTIFSTPIEAPDDASLSRRGARRREREAIEALAEVALNGASIEHYSDGAPYVEGHSGRYISVSHSGHLAVIALADIPVGVDVEEARPTLLRIAPRFLSSGELLEYRGLDRLLTAWTLKEAAYKALRPEAPATAMPLPPAQLPYTIHYTGPHPDFPSIRLSVVTA